MCKICEFEERKVRNGEKTNSDSLLWMIESKEDSIIQRRIESSKEEGYYLRMVDYVLPCYQGQWIVNFL